MSSEAHLEVYRQLRAGKDKYVYFLLAAAGAAIALAVARTEQLPLSRSQLPLAFAVGMWALSFVFGCLSLERMNELLDKNTQLLKFGVAKPDGNYSADDLQVQRVLRSLMNEYVASAERYGRYQFALLVLGAVAYLEWHVIEMLIRTEP